MDDTVDEPPELTDPDSIAARCGHTGENMRNKILAVAVAAAGVAFSGASMAATNPATVSVGAPGTTVTSQGDLTVSVNIPHRIMISGLQNINLDDTPAGTPVYYGTGAGVSGSSPACVYRNGSSATYALKATSANASAGAFRMASTAATPEFITYSVQWAGVASNLVEGASNTGLTPDSRTSTTCGGSPVAAKVTVSATDAALGAVNPGYYSDTLTLLVTAE